MASGYLKVEEIEYRGLTLEPWYSLSITNLETVSMFSNMFKSWFAAASANYNEFIKAMLNGDVKAMNLYMNDIALPPAAQVQIHDKTALAGSARTHVFQHQNY